MSSPVSGTDDETPQPRPRPSWGHPGPAEPTAPLPDPAPTRADPGSGPPTYPTPSYGAPTYPGHGQPPPHPYAYGSPPVGNPPGGGDRQQPPPGWTPSGGPPGWTPPGWTPPGTPPGAPTPWPAPPGWNQPSAAQYGQDLGRHEQAFAHMYGEKPRTGMAIAAMVLGLVAVVLCWVPLLSYVAVVLGVLAVIFGIIGVRRNVGRGMAVTGIVTGIIGLIAATIFSVVYTRIGLEYLDIATQCAEEVGSTSGPAFERCVTRTAPDGDPFEFLSR